MTQDELRNFDSLLNARLDYQCYLNPFDNWTDETVGSVENTTDTIKNVEEVQQDDLDDIIEENIDDDEFDDIIAQNTTIYDLDDITYEELEKLLEEPSNLQFLKF